MVPMFCLPPVEKIWGVEKKMLKLIKRQNMIDIKREKEMRCERGIGGKFTTRVKRKTKLKKRKLISVTKPSSFLAFQYQISMFNYTF